MDFTRVSICYLSSDGGNWAQYLQIKLSTEEYAFETLLTDLSWVDSAENFVRSAKLNLFLLTPNFLDTYKDWSIFETFDKRTAVLVLTGTDYYDLQTVACSNNCDYLMDWPIHELRGDDNSVRELLIKIIKMYEAYSDVGMPVSPRHDEGNHGGYDALSGITRQVNNVSEILQKKNRVYIITERAPEGRISIELPNGHIIIPECLSKAAVFRFNSEDVDGSNFSVILNEGKIGAGKLQKSGPEQVYDTPIARYTNCGTQTQTSNPNALGNDEYENVQSCSEHRQQQQQSTTNQSTESKLEQLRNILEEETSPLKLLCQSLNIDEEDIETLDEELSTMVEGVEALRKLSIPTNMHFIDDPTESVWPSLLHFGAQYNLKKFCHKLLDNRLMHRACAVPNMNGLVPHELALKYGHDELAEVLTRIQLDDIGNQDAKYDSGFDGESYRSSKLSETSEPEEPAPPPPHDVTSNRKTSDSGKSPVAMGKIAEESPDEDEATDRMLEEAQRKQMLSRTSGESPIQTPSGPPLPSPTKPHKKGGLFKMFSVKKNKQRRYSEPSVPTEIIQQLSDNKYDTLRRKKMTTFKKATSPSEPAPPMCMGAANTSGDQDSQIRRKKGPVSSIFGLADTNKRQSMRLNFALQDTSLSAPKLPLRK